MIKIQFILASLFLLVCSCSPLRSPFQEKKHQLELTLHEVQTNIDDTRHDINCLQTEIQILDSKMKHQENAVSHLKKQWVEQYQLKIDKLEKLIEEKTREIQQILTKDKNISEDIRQLTSHANETTSALTQYKKRINELEKEIFSQNKKLQEIAKLNVTLQNVMRSLKNVTESQVLYKVKSGDSLEKIAKKHMVSVEEIKKANHLEQDLIVIGQELVIPSKK